MEGVGARLGRSSTRYVPATVFSGPVRKWKKRWIHVTPSPNHNNIHSHHHNNAPSNAPSSSPAANHSSSSNGNNSSHLLLYKWTPLFQSNGSSSTTNNYDGNNINTTTNNHANLSNGDAAVEPPRRKFKYIPVDLLEKQKKEAEEQEASENVDDESKPSNTDPNAAEPVSKSDSAVEKPDINDVPMEENQDDNQVVRQDLNESTLDLSLGLVS